MRRGSPAVQAKCRCCHKFLHLWNKHTLCIPCSVKENLQCSPDSPCQVCQDWPQDQWSLYLHGVKDARIRSVDRVKKRLVPAPTSDRPGSSLAAFSPGLHGSAGFPPAPGSFPPGPQTPFYGPFSAPWAPAWQDPGAYRAFLQQQLAVLGPVPDELPDDILEAGLEDAERLSPLPARQPPRSRSPVSSTSSREFLGFTPLDLPESPGGSIGSRRRARAPKRAPASVASRRSTSSSTGRPRQTRRGM